MNARAAPPLQRAPRRSAAGAGGAARAARRAGLAPQGRAPLDGRRDPKMMRRAMDIQLARGAVSPTFTGDRMTQVREAMAQFQAAKAQLR